MRSFVVSLTSLCLMVGLLSFVSGCQDPYDQPNGPAPQGRNVTSLSQVYKKKNEDLADKAGADDNTPDDLWRVTLGNAPVLGAKDALVTITEFSDFQCPFCGRGAKTLKKILQQYPSKVRIAFKHYPLNFHKDAHLAAQASIAAQKQGKFWQMHDKLFQNTRTLKRADLDRYAKELGLDMAKFKAALDKGTYKADVNADMAQGNKVKVQGTPTVFVNGRTAKLDPAKLKALVEEEIKRAEAMKASTGKTGNALYAALIKNGKPKFELWKVETGNAPFKGAKDSLVTIVEFSDFQCPFCSKGAKALDKALKKYPKRVRLVFKQYPLSFHKDAHLAAQAALAAHAQGKYWEMHDKLFQSTSKLKRKHLEQYAKELKLDMKKFKAALDSRKYAAQVDADMSQGNRVKVSGTPTVFVNGRPGSADANALSGMIEEEIKRTADLIKKGLRGEKLYAKVIAEGKIKAKAKVVRTPPPPPRKPEVIKEVAEGDAPSIGPDDAPVTIIEFSDFECPFCSKGANTAKKIYRAAKGKVRLVFKHNPLNFHPYAKLAARASVAAQGQDKFWEYHDKLFQDTKKLTRAHLLQYARELELDIRRFTQVMDSNRSKVHVESDLKQGSRVGVNGTPAFFVNGRFVNGAQPYDKFKEMVNEELKKKGFKDKDLVGDVKEEIPLNGTPIVGKSQAPVTLVEFSDFQCPFCGRAAKTLKKVKAAYKDKVRVAFKHYPLSFHKEAHLAAQASMAAHAQGKFWEMHDLLFLDTKKLKRPDLDKYAQELGLDMTKFKAALDNGTYKSVVDADMALGNKVGVQGTPTVFMNGTQLKKVGSFADFKSAIDPVLLAKGYKKSDLPEEPENTIPLAEAPFKGPKKAAVTLVEFSDFQCPFCSRGAQTIKKVLATFPKHVRVAFKHYPLSFHKDAHLAAQAAVAAQKQGKFWEMHDKLFQNTRTLKRADLDRYAKELNLDMAKFKTALDKGFHKARVNKDMREGTDVGVQGTPTFFVNNKKASNNADELIKKIRGILVAKGLIKAKVQPKKAAATPSLHRPKPRVARLKDPSQASALKNAINTFGKGVTVPPTTTLPAPRR